MEDIEIKLLEEIKTINKNAPAQQGYLLTTLSMTQNELNISLNKLYEKGLIDAKSTRKNRGLTGEKYLDFAHITAI